MTGDRETEGKRRAGPRAVTYCLVPADLAQRLHEPLRRHFRDNSSVEIVVERRGRERRAAADRRSGEAPPIGGVDRRQVRAAAGRRVAERRATPVEAEVPELPRRMRRLADRLTFFQRLEPRGLEAEDLDTSRQVVAFQAGECQAFDVLYSRYFDRVYGYMRVALRDPHEAEDATQQVFVKLLEKLPEYERRSQPFRAWLFTVVRNEAVSQLRKHGRADVVDPAELDRRRELPDRSESPTDLTTLNWIGDRDLLLLVERLTPWQRQVLVLRFMLDLSVKETAEVLGRSPNEVSALQHRATVFLRKRLVALGRAPAHRGGARMRAWLKPAQVLRRRRSALIRQ